MPLERFVGAFSVYNLEQIIVACILGEEFDGLIQGKLIGHI